MAFPFLLTCLEAAVRHTQYIHSRCFYVCGKSDIRAEVESENAVAVAGEFVVKSERYINKNGTLG